jgi:maltose O-acetyltransferase
MLRDMIINGVASSCFFPRKLRRVIYTLYGMDIHTSAISPRCFMGGNKLSVGKNTFINYNNFFDLTNRISIGNNVRIGMCCRFITGSHEIGPSEMRGGYPFLHRLQLRMAVG